ncbi:right-handed parallel beta-helix repeat-containing protein [Endothiovibrio diazotrophicus]
MKKYLLVLLLTGLNAQAETYYIDGATGDDLHDGLSPSSPWATVQRAAETLVAGDTAYIRGGVYPLYLHPSVRELAPQNSGNAEQGYITFAAYADETPILDGGNRTPSVNGLVSIRDKEYIRISGLTVRNVDDGNEGIGIYVENARHIVIDGNHVHHTDSSGIQVFTKSAMAGAPCADITIDGNDVEDTNRRGPNEMITVSGVDGFEVRNNRVHNRQVGSHGGEGIDVKQGSRNGSIHHNEVWDLNTDAPGIYLDAWDQLTENIDLYANWVHDIDTFGVYIGSERGGVLRDIRIYNNVINDNRRGAIMLADESSFSGSEPLEAISIFNNTLVANSVALGWYGAITVENPYVDGLAIRNNIAVGNGGYQISDYPASTRNVVIDGNLLDGDLGDDDQGRIDSGLDLSGSPLFTDAANGDFSPQAGSDVIDRGSNGAIPNDRFDQDGDGDTGESLPYDAVYASRIVNGQVDIGAHEWAPAAVISNPTPTPTPTPTAVPAEILTPAPTLLSLGAPANGAVLSADDTPTFRWEGAEDSLFRFQFAWLVDGVLSDIYTIPASGWGALTELRPATDTWRAFAQRMAREQARVYWRVAERAADGSEVYSDIRGFVVGQ